MAFASVLAIAGMAVAFSATPAFADDAVAPASSDDSTYYFEFSNFGDQAWTAQRSKDDDTASYINVNNMTIYDVFLYIDGIDYGGNVNTQLTRGSHAYLIDPGQWNIHNFVYENGYPNARLRGMANESGVLGGVWSPDSYYVYNSLN